MSGCTACSDDKVKAHQWVHGGGRVVFVLFDMERFGAANSVVWLPFLYLYHSGCKVRYRGLFRGFSGIIASSLVLAVLHVGLFVP